MTLPVHFTDQNQRIGPFPIRGSGTYGRTAPPRNLREGKETVHQSLTPEQGSQPSPKVVAVVVTFNRVHLLPKTLSGISGGRKVPDQVVLVDNASTDQTLSYVESLDYPLPLDVVALPQNTGGAGGFTVGIDRALSVHDADLVWVMDDDTEPLEGTLEESVEAWQRYADAPEERPAFVASHVVWTDGREHPMNSMIQRIGASRARKARAAAVGAKTIRSGSFVSLLMDAAAMRRVGLPIVDYFIWNDDFEYSTRLARFRDAISLPTSVVAHHTKTFGTTDANPGPRFYNDVRNKLWVFTRSQSLAPWEKILYAGATGRLWFRTLQKATARADVAALLGRGIRDALRAPRTNDQALRGIYSLRSHAVPGSAAPLQPKAEDEDAFSVLMPVYHGDEPQALRTAFASATWEQTLRPHEVVVVVDGPIAPALDQELHALEAEAGSRGIEVVIQRLVENGGLANALNVGLRRCSYRVVARVDADDASLPQRFERQVPLVSSGAYDVVGSAMLEMSGDLLEVQSVRHVETDQAAIRRVASLRNPICHPTVVFDVDQVRAAGGYEPIPGAEDYGLWTRMMRDGAVVGNLDEALVKYRAGIPTWKRRGGVAAVRREYELQSHLRASGFIGMGQWARNVVVRGGYRLVPRAWRIGAYRALISRRGSKDSSIDLGAADRQTDIAGSEEGLHQA